MQGPAVESNPLRTVYFVETPGEKGKNAWKLLLGVSGARQCSWIFGCVVGWGCIPALHSHVAVVGSLWAAAGVCQVSITP